MVAHDAFGAATTIETPLGALKVFSPSSLREAGIGDVDRLPYSIKVLLESCLRNLDGHAIREEHVLALASYDGRKVDEVEIPFRPGRVILQDFTGVPAMVDLAALRSAMARLGGDVRRVNPQVPCDLVIDHSVQIDEFGGAGAFAANVRREFERNSERYAFLKWGQHSFANFQVVPPARGIVHQVNLEYLASVVLTQAADSAHEGQTIAYPDSLVGTDSHTTMINGLGVVGWGVGGIEAEAVMLGQPIYILLPEVIGVRLTGRLREGITATDLVLTVTERLRQKGVVGRFVEFFGPGLDEMPLPLRATVANMAPEYGATMGFFPVDEQTLAYLDQTGRDPKRVRTVEQVSRGLGLWRDDSLPIQYTDVVELDIDEVEASLAGPSRPQDRIALTDMHAQWRRDRVERFGRPASTKGVTIELDGQSAILREGAVVMAAITSCTNTSNPTVLIAAGLVARKARALGLRRKPWVKTSLAPGSRVVTDYLDKAGLTPDLEAVGFYTAGYGCTTCIGNSGPLSPEIEEAISKEELVVAAVLSGNRNFEGRVHPRVKAAYLASPPLCVIYALTGTVDIDLFAQPIGRSPDGNDVYMRDIWPTAAEIQDVMSVCIGRDQYVERYADIFEGPDDWRQIQVPKGDVYNWDDSSSYIQEPPFFQGLTRDVPSIEPIRGARVLMKLGDSVTTDHISPAGAIPVDSPAGRFLVGAGVKIGDFNSYGSRRGNDRVMTRGTFANIRIRNEMVAPKEGGYTKYLGPELEATPTDTPPAPGEVVFVHDAAMAYERAGVPLVVLAGKDYGMGSSRDWAAKGTYLLGVRAVIAESYERIHRSNLVFMGVLPLQLQAGQTRDSLGLRGDERFDIEIDEALQPNSSVAITAVRPDGGKVEITARCRIDTPVEVEYFRNGGILHTVLRKLI